MKKKQLLALCLAGLLTGSLAACKGNTDGPQGGEYELAIYAVNLGDGIGWVQGLMEGFKNEPWVKEKYPELTYYFQYNDSEAYATDLMEGGKGGNPYDLMFGAYLSQYSSPDMVYDMAESVYNAIIPGEGVTVKSKMSEEMIQNKATQNAAGGTSYYSINWSASLEGIAYNAEKLAAMGYEMPVTTDELLAVSAAISEKDGYAWLSSREGNGYWSYMFNPLVAQYMTPEGYRNFFNGIDQYGRMSNKIFESKASLRVMEFMEELFKYDTSAKKYKYLYSGSDDLDYMAAQLQFYKGTGVFMPNGSWLETEMSNLVQKAQAAGQKTYDIRFMKYPIISAIIEVLPDKTITDDATLAAVVRAVDAGETSYAGVSEDDFAYIAEARAVVKYVNDLDCCIPAYSDSKELAADFLIYAASENGIKAYYQGSNTPSPFYYDVKAKAPDIYNNMSSFGRSRIDIMYGNALYEWEVSVPSTNTRMASYGGIALTRMDYKSFYGNFSQPDTSNIVSAQEIWQETKDYWTAERFSEALRQAGY